MYNGKRDSPKKYIYIYKKKITSYAWMDSLSCNTYPTWVTPPSILLSLSVSNFHVQSHPFPLPTRHHCFPHSSAPSIFFPPQCVMSRSDWFLHSIKSSNLPLPKKLGCYQTQKKKTRKEVGLGLFPYRVDYHVKLG